MVSELENQPAIADEANAPIVAENPADQVDRTRHKKSVNYREVCG